MEETPFNLMKCPCGGLLTPMTETTELGAWESQQFYLCQKCSEVVIKTSKEVK